MLCIRPYETAGNDSDAGSVRADQHQRAADQHTMRVRRIFGVLLGFACAWPRVAAEQSDAYTRYDGRPMHLFPSVREAELRRHCLQRPIFIEEIHFGGGLHGGNGTGAPSFATVAVLSDVDLRTVRDRGIACIIATIDLGELMRSRGAPGMSGSASMPSAADGRRLGSMTVGLWLHRAEPRPIAPGACSRYSSLPSAEAMVYTMANDRRDCCPPAFSRRAVSRRIR
jgi:hypothetical protein